KDCRTEGRMGHAPDISRLRAGRSRHAGLSRRTTRGMSTVSRERSTLLVVDFQARLMPAIDDGKSVVANARRLLTAADMLRVPILFTEQNANGLGGTLPELQSGTHQIAHKMTFDACRTAGF